VVVSFCATWSECRASLDDVDVVVVAIDDLGSNDNLSGLRRLWKDSDLPVVLCMPITADNVRTSVLEDVHADALVLLDSEEETLPRIVMELASANIVRSVARVLGEKAAAAPILARALQRAFEQVPPPPDAARARRARGEEPFVRSVNGLAEWMGCRPDYLTRMAQRNGIALSTALRWLTVLRGMSLYRASVTTWHEVAVRLGFNDPSGWTHFVRQLTGSTPSELAGRPWSELLDRALVDL